MRKLISILIAVVFLLSASACGNNGSNEKLKPNQGSHKSENNSSNSNGVLENNSSKNGDLGTDETYPPDSIISDIFGTTTPDHNTITVPNFVGMTLEDVCRKYTNLKLQINYVYDNTPAGTVILQDKNEGSIIKASETIAITVSMGPKMVKVPYLSNLNQADAKNELKRLGINYTVTAKAHDTITKDHVIHTNPMGGTLIEYGSTIEVYVSAGPEAKYIDNVDCTKLTITQARVKIEKAGFNLGTVTYEDSSYPKNIVIRQNPDIASNPILQKGSEIDLVVSSGKN